MELTRRILSKAKMLLNNLSKKERVDLISLESTPKRILLPSIGLKTRSPKSSNMQLKASEHRQHI